MMGWLLDEIRKCKEKMDVAARAHSLTVYAREAARKKAFEECLDYLRGMMT